jgi:hypothetical protein
MAGDATRKIFPKPQTEQPFAEKSENPDAGASED